MFKAGSSIVMGINDDFSKFFGEQGYITSKRVGNQIWMMENLKVTNLLDGTNILPCSPNTLVPWQTQGIAGNPACHGAYVRHFNDDGSVSTGLWDISSKIGTLYNGYAITDYSTGKSRIGIPGWRIPTIDDWTELFDYLVANTSATKVDNLNVGNTNNTVGKVLKAIGPELWSAELPLLWNSRNAKHTDESGLSFANLGIIAQSGAYQYPSFVRNAGVDENRTHYAVAGAEADADNCYVVTLQQHNQTIDAKYDALHYQAVHKRTGIAVRLIKDIKGLSA